MNIQDKLKAIDQVINDAMHLRKQVQRECKHINQTLHPECFNDPWGVENEYWITVRCPDCGHIRVVDQKDCDGVRNPEYYSLLGAQA